VSSTSMSAGEREAEQPEVAVIGLGYMGLTLAVTFATAGLATVGVDGNPAVADAVGRGRPPFFEPGLAEALGSLPRGRLTVRTTPPDVLPPAVVICVGTPVDPATREPAFDALDAAAGAIADRADPGTLVVIRSTVPVGTARSRVLPRLVARCPSPQLAVCPERTIQGRALAELTELPQVIGGLDERSARRADELFARIVPHRVLVSSPEAAEMVKLVNNAHTDVIYGFGNEVAVMASAAGLDADEIISAANVGYPRPDVSRPGFVGGSCLTKDPYLLMHSVAAAGVRTRLIAAARALNEAVPGQIADLVAAALGQAGRPLSGAKVLVCGIAYKGRPETDDVRGAASVELARVLDSRVGLLAGHDFLVPPERIASLGYLPTSLEAGLTDADALVLLTDHPGYAPLDLATVVARMRPPAIVFDLWGLVRDTFEGSDKVTYLRWGRA
jgi:UDP-N-acetyl-D-mannosaminuronic acid dehydrogenase